MAEPGRESPGATTFGHQVGRDTRERAQLASENFDLHLRIHALENKVKKNEQSAWSRRETVDGQHFYDFDDADEHGTVSKEQFDEMAETYRTERVRLLADLESAQAEAAASAAAAEAADKEADDADARAREAQRLAAAEQKAVEDLVSELQSAKAKMALQSSEIEDAHAEAKRAEKAVALRVDGLQLQVNALEDAVAVARNEKLQAEAANRGLEEKLRRANLKLEEAAVQKGGGASDRASAEVGCDESNSRELIRLRMELDVMSKRYDAISSNVDLKRKTALTNAANPPGVDMENSDLSVPGFELYQRLCKKVRSGRRGSLVVLGEGRTREWRKVVLNEMNDGLVMLYRQSERLEDDRAQFVERHCRFLLEKEPRAALEEMKENKNDQ